MKGESQFLRAREVCESRIAPNPNYRVFPPPIVVQNRYFDKGLLLEFLLLVFVAFSLTHPSNPEGCRSGVELVDSTVRTVVQSDNFFYVLT